MSEHSTLDTTAEEVAAFAAAVRERLVDLAPEEREELAGDLEADLGDLVADRGPGALGDPAAYARELRTAAGLEAEPRVTPRRQPAGQRVERLLQASRERWLGAVRGLPGRPWELVVALRPVWWVLRAWVALSLVDLLLGSGSVNLGLSLVPSLLGWGAPLLAVAVVLSVMIGLGRLWPGTGGLRGRLVLLVLNAVAIAVTPVCASGYTSAADVEDWYAGPGPVSEGLVDDGRTVHNIHPYDAQGRPLTGVQLLDQDGNPITVSRGWTDEETWVDVVLTPWRSGLRDVGNVYPMPQRVADPATGRAEADPALPDPPVPTLPAVQLDGVVPSRLSSAEPAPLGAVPGQPRPSPGG